MYIYVYTYICMYKYTYIWVYVRGISDHTTGQGRDQELVKNKTKNYFPMVKITWLLSNLVPICLPHIGIVSSWLTQCDHAVNARSCFPSLAIFILGYPTEAKKHIISHHSTSCYSTLDSKRWCGFGSKPCSPFVHIKIAGIYGCSPH